MASHPPHNPPEPWWKRGIASFTGFVQAWWKRLFAVLFWCLVMLGAGEYWWHALIASETGPCEGNPNAKCVYALDYAVAHPLSGDKAVPPVVSWKLALVAAALTLLAFFLHVVRAESESARANARGAAAETLVATHDGVHRRSVWERVRDWLWLLFGWLLPAGMLFGAMIQGGYRDAAAFALALAAIYVAAEHYSSLEQQRRLVDAQKLALENINKRTSENLTKQQEASAEQLRIADAQQTLLRKLDASLDEKIGSIENALGTQYGTQKIYESYALRPEVPETHSDGGPSQESRDIHAIYRFFSIDSEWWNTPSWEAYLSKETWTLYRALVAGQRRQVLIVASLEWPRPMHRAVPDDKKEHETDDKRAVYFGQLIGLIWHWTVLWYVRRCLLDQKPQEAVNISVRVAQTQQWLHVVGIRVYQILGQQADSLRVRNLTFDLKESRGALAEWARKEVSDVAVRGPTAKEYICARLLMADETLTFDRNHKIDDYETMRLLDQLGMKQWLTAAPRPPGGEEFARKRCVKLVRDFLALACNGKPRTDTADFVATLNLLAKEVE